jgi:hypothetical protein
MKRSTTMTFICVVTLMVATLTTFINQQVLAQTPTSTVPKPMSPKVLPGNSLARFDFFYAGEAKKELMFRVQDGKIAWSYTHPVSKGEISDAMILSNNNILFAHQFGISEITPDQKVAWNYDAPEGCEIHTAQAIGKDHVIFFQNGNPAKVIVMNKLTNKIVKELVIPVKNPASIHGQVRHARLTKAGTYLIALMDFGKVVEYDATGKELMSMDAPGVWSAEELKNGNILITTGKVIREVNRNQEAVWEYTLADIPDYTIKSPQLSVRLKNGNTIINNWFNQWNGDGKVDLNNQPVQAIEVTRDKKIVWALRTWSDTENLGPSTIIIPLKEAHVTEKVSFGDIH